MAVFVEFGTILHALKYIPVVNNNNFFKEIVEKVDSNICIFATLGEFEIFEGVRKLMPSCFAMESPAVSDEIKKAFKVTHKGIHVYSSVCIIL